MEQQNKKIKELQEDYKIVFGSDQGKKVLQDLKKRCHFYTTTHVQGDSHESAFFEGQRSIIVFVENFINQKS